MREYKEEPWKTPRNADGGQECDFKLMTRNTCPETRISVFQTYACFKEETKIKNKCKKLPGILSVPGIISLTGLDSEIWCELLPSPLQPFFSRHIMNCDASCQPAAARVQTLRIESHFEVHTMIPLYFFGRPKGLRGRCRRSRWNGWQHKNPFKGVQNLWSHHSDRLREVGDCVL